MGAVRVLDQELINRIAAGEVIERPASVVKELLENALDAGAASISVEVEGSGLDLLRVADDGSGMNPAELETAILRHATSKISTTEDLFSIRTLGFRGEALPSILSVSRSRIATRDGGSPAGWQIALEAGEIRQRGRKGMPRGTVVEVADLFFNTPARRKFLKTPATEGRHIVDVVSRYSLAYPAVRFSLSLGGRTILNLGQGAFLEDRVREIWGRDAAQGLTVLSEERGDVLLRGVLAPPGTTRPNRSGIFTYVNGRSVTDGTLRAAVMEGYSGLLMKGRCPQAVLFVDMDAREVDVNVHPAKAEVRFRNPSALFGAVAGAIRRALGPPPVYEGSGLPESPGGPVLQAREPGLPYPQTGISPPLPRKPSLVAELQPGLVQGGLFSRAPRVSYGDKTVVGVFHSTYILLEDDASLYILDQHAAHERVTYERLRKASMGERGPVQDLLAPLVLEVSALELGAFEEIAAELSSLGIEVELFGSGALAVRSVPAFLGSSDIRAIVLDLLGAVLEGGPGRKGLRDDLLTRVACHASVRAGRKLEAAEIAALLRDLDAAGSPLTCPHGRPLFKAIGRDEIEKWIGRRP